MATVEVDQRHQLGESMLEEIRQTAERRLREIEPLIEEAERLQDVLSALDQKPSEDVPRPRTRGLQRDAHRSRRTAGSAAPRAAKGANKRVILALIAERPGITPAEIAASTGMKRTVVASTVSRLKRYGELCDYDGGGLRVPLAGQSVNEPAPVNGVASLPRRRAA